MHALELDHQFLLEGDVFDEDTIAMWVDAKINEHRDLQARPHPYEVETYFDF